MHAGGSPWPITPRPRVAAGPMPARARSVIDDQAPSEHAREAGATFFQTIYLLTYVALFLPGPQPQRWARRTSGSRCMEASRFLCRRTSGRAPTHHVWAPAAAGLAR